MTQTSMSALFLEAVSAGIHGRRVQWEPLPQDVLSALFRLAETQKLLPLLIDTVCGCQDGDPLFPVYRGAARQQVLRQAQKDASFRPVYRQLGQAGIRALLVKGSLCRSVYPNGGLRISGDEDLLVEESRFVEACRILSDAGLIPLSPEDPRQADEIGWRSRDGLLTIELHKYLFSPGSGPFGLLQTVFSGVFSRARSYPLEGAASVLSLSPHDHLLYLLLHAMKHFIRTGFGLRQICDVGLWAARWGEEVDWALLLEQTKQVHGERFSAALFAIAETRLQIPLKLPPFWQENRPDPGPMLEDLLEGGIYGSSSGSRAHTARITQDAVAARQQGKRRSLRTALFPPAKELEQDYPVLKEHPGLLPAIWQQRLIRYLKKSAVSPEDSPGETLRLGRERLALLREYGILE